MRGANDGPVTSDGHELPALVVEEICPEASRLQVKGRRRPPGIKRHAVVAIGHRDEFAAARRPEPPAAVGEREPSRAFATARCNRGAGELAGDDPERRDPDDASCAKACDTNPLCRPEADRNPSRSCWQTV